MTCATTKEVAFFFFSWPKLRLGRCYDDVRIYPPFFYRAETLARVSLYLTEEINLRDLFLAHRTSSFCHSIGYSYRSLSVYYTSARLSKVAKGQGGRSREGATPRATARKGSKRDTPLHATRRTPHGAWRLVQAMSAWLVKTRRAPSWDRRNARVYDHTTAAMHKLSTPPPPQALTS